MDGPRGAKAQALLEAGRVLVIRPDVALVCGATGWYRVRAWPGRVECSCEAKIELCSHAIAALVAWYEHHQEAVRQPQIPPVSWSEPEPFR